MSDNPNSTDSGHQPVKIEEKITSGDSSNVIQNLHSKTSEQKKFSEENLFKFQGFILSKLSLQPSPDQSIEKKQEEEKEEPKVKKFKKPIVKEPEQEKGQSKVSEPEKTEQLKEKEKEESKVDGLEKTEQSKENEKGKEKVSEPEKTEQPKEKENKETNLPTKTTSSPPTTYGYCGLTNLGLSCYANSCLQVFFNLSPFRQYLLTHSERGPFHKSLADLFSAMQALSTSLEKPNKSVSCKPDQFMRQFRAAKRDFSSYRMADAQEFFTILLDMLHQEANEVEKKISQRPKAEPKTPEEAWAYHEQYIDHSFWSSQLMGQVESSLNCLTCGHKSLSWSCIWQLQLPLVAKKVVPQEQKEKEEQLFRFNSLETLGKNKHIPTASSITSAVTLSDCLKAFLDGEKLTDDCAPHCTQCSQRCPATKSMTICRAPKILLVHLTRFLPDGSKNLEPVNIDEHIVLSSSTSYTLHSAVLHFGCINYGHYITLYSQQQPTQQQGSKQSEGEQQQQWIMLDDDIVDKKLAKSNATGMLEKCAYLIIYQLDESQ